jgi:eukaryotic-like serine/threonine-protein kinase
VSVRSSWPEVERILSEVMDTPPTQRRARIEELCGNNPAMRYEVESLLEAHEAAGSFLESDTHLAELPATLIGRQIGAYRLCEAIGTGGMGTVYRAERHDGRFQMQVAIKVAFAALHSAELLRRFAVEQQILAALDHPNISRLLDAGISVEGIPYLIMEYVEGVPIDRYAREITVQHKMQLFRAVCTAVDYAHRQQIAHRDIKPSNILVRADGQPKLLDFGIAKIVDQWRNSGPAAAQTVLIPLTPDYASPEQARGEAVTTTTDIYSLGVLLYQMLTGRRPYEVGGKSLADAVRIVCEQEPERPSIAVRKCQGSPGGMDGDIPAELDAIVLKAMEKHPSRRYASAHDFCCDVSRYLEGSDVEAHKERRWLFLSRVRRPKLVATPGWRLRGYAALATVSLLALLVFWGRSLSPRKPAAHGAAKLTLAILPFENLTGDPTEDFVSDGFTEEMISRTAELNHERLGVIARTSSMSYKGSTKSAQQIGRELNADYLLEGSIRNWGDRVRITARLLEVSSQKQIWAESYDRNTDQVLTLEAEIAEKVANEMDVTLLPRARERLAANPGSVRPEAYAAYLRGRYFWNQRTEEGLNKGIGYFKQAIDLEPSYAPAFVGIADCYSLLALRGFMPAKEAFPKAKASVERALALDDGVGQAYATKAHLRLHDWDWTGLDAEFKRALELDPADAIAYRWYSEYLSTVGRMDESIAIVEKAARVDPVSPIVGTTLPREQYFAGRYDEAIDLLKKDLELDPRHFFVHLRLGQTYVQKKMYVDAIDEMKKAVAFSNRSSETLAGLAQAYAAAGMTDGMNDTLQELTRDPVRRYFSSYEVAKVYACAGNRDLTFKWLERAYQEHNPDLIELRAEPIFIAQRSDPRFQTLLRRIGWSS